MESKKTPTDSASKPYKKVRSPGQIAGIAFVVTVVIGFILVAGISVIGLLSGMSSSLAKTYDTVTSGACPAAIVVALIAYFLAKRREGN